LKEGTSFLQEGAAADVLEVGAVLHADGRASFLGQLVTVLVEEWTATRGLPMKNILLRRMLTFKAFKGGKLAAWFKALL